MEQKYLSVKQLAGEIGTNKLTIHRAVTYSPTYRGGGFSLKYSNLYSINELSPCVPRL